MYNYGAVELADFLGLILRATTGRCGWQPVPLPGSWSYFGNCCLSAGMMSPCWLNAVLRDGT